MSTSSRQGLNARLLCIEYYSPDAIVMVVAQIVCKDVQLSAAIRKLLIDLILSLHKAYLTLHITWSADLLSLCTSSPRPEVDPDFMLPVWYSQMAGNCWSYWRVWAMPAGSADKTWLACFWSRHPTDDMRQWWNIFRCLLAEMHASTANLVREYLHIGSQTNKRLKFMTMAAARDRHSPTCSVGNQKVWVSFYWGNICFVRVNPEKSPGDLGRNEHSSSILDWDLSQWDAGLRKERSKLQLGSWWVHCDIVVKSSESVAVWILFQNYYGSLHERLKDACVRIWLPHTWTDINEWPVNLNKVNEPVVHSSQWC